MKPFEYEPLDLQQHNIRLLRLSSRRNIEISCEIFPAKLPKDDVERSSLSFEALSYAWGEPELVNPIQVNGKELWITNNLHIALSHLRLADRDRVLWIDAICIDQKNLVERNQQVQQMKDIYSQAETVIFWLERATFEGRALLISLQELESKALRFSNKCWSFDDHWWRDLWSSVQRSCGYTDAVCTTGLQTLLRRPWFSRIWILQEVANARKGVVCTSDSAVSAAVFALAPMLLRTQATQQRQSVLDIMSKSSLNPSWLSSNPNLFEMLSKFIDSQATDTRDKIHALLNISSDGHKFSIDYTKSLAETVRETFTSFLYHPSAQVVSIFDLLTKFDSLTTVCLVQVNEDSYKYNFESLMLEWVKNQKLGSTSLNREQIRDFRIMRNENSISSSTPLIIEEYAESSRSCFKEVSQLTKSERVGDNSHFAQHDRTYYYRYENLHAVMCPTMGQNLIFLAVRNASQALVEVIPHVHLEIVRALLNNGADPMALVFDPNAYDDSESGDGSPITGNECERTAIQAALACVRMDVITVLFEFGAKNMLHEACRQGLLGLARHLLELGADVNEQAQKSPRELECAKFSHNRRHGGIFTYTTPLVEAIRHDQLGLVRELLDKGADIELPAHGDVCNKCLRCRYGGRVYKGRVDYYTTPLVEAAKRNNTRVMELLIERGASLDMRSGENFDNPLQAAIKRNNVEAVRTLLDAGANVYPKGGYGHALLGTRLSIQSLLFQRGADLRCFPPDHRALLLSEALHEATSEGRVDRAKELLGQGAEPRNVNSFLRAARYGQSAILAFMLHRSVESSIIDRTLEVAACHGHESTVDLLLRRGANVEGSEQSACTPLQEAVVGLHKPVVELLLEHGASVNASGRGGWRKGIIGRYPTAMDAAIATGDDGLLRMLQAEVEQKKPAKWFRAFRSKRM